MKKLFKHRTIRKELFILYIILVTTILSVTGIFIGSTLYNSTRVRVIEDSAELAYSIGNTVNMYINDTNDSLKILGEVLENIEASHGVNSDEIDRILVSFVRNNEEFEKLRIVDQNGIVTHVIPFSKSEIGNNLSHAPYISNMEGFALWSDVFLSAVSGDPSVTVSHRVKDNYIVLDISLNNLNLLLSEIKRNSEIIIYDSKGRAVASSNIEEVYYGVNHSNMEHVREALSGNLITDEFKYSTKNGELDMLGTAIPLNNNWVAVVAKELSQAYSSVNSILFTILFAALLAFVIGYFVFQFISGRIKAPINSLIEWSDQLAVGKYNNTFQLDSYSELNKLAESFRQMSTEVEAREIELNTQKSELNASNEELESYNEEMAAMNEELIDSEKRANESNLAKSEFLANMSHELRTPLNGIMGFTQILKASELTAEQSEYIDNVLYSSQHLLQIINDILDFSKIEAGKLDLEQIDINLKELLENTFTLIKPSADKKGLNALLKVDRNLPERVTTDPLRLSQIIINLLSNAVKFTEEGQIGLEVYSLMKNKKKARIRFVVFDSGIGIPEDKQMTIFDMFTQVDSSFTRKYGGTGLGLSISNRILEQMGSRMIIESEMGKGSVFSFELELETVSLKPKGKDEKALKNEIRTICEKKMTILIVEDDLINAKLAKTVIKKNLLNSVVISAGDGQEGVEKYFEYSPDLVLMDLHMPVKNGFEALKEIRSREKEGRKAMIIALTADAREDRAKHCLESGFDEYISKPFEKDILMEKILRLCKQE